ncbi:hypothetical protein ACFY05_32245 [Microtetraspora fusca]|uniref:Uncharacterized protein n=1 Tax=Microtetraspora fusca TaxID=1997 RepID=A0ABW6VEW5_MICFU
MSTPVTPPLVVSAAEVARRLRLPQPLPGADLCLVEQALLDAQADVEAYLGRPITPRTYTQTGVASPADGRFRLDHEPVLSILSVTPETHPVDGYPTGRYTVVYTAGLDAVTDPDLAPIRRLVRDLAIHSPVVQSLFRRLLPDEARRVTSLSVEGQSVTYADTYPTAPASSGERFPGSPLPFSSVDRWRLAGRRVRQFATRATEPWPYEWRDYYRWGE